MDETASKNAAAALHRAKSFSRILFLSFRFFSCFFLTQPGAAKDVLQRVVRFVACIFVYLFVRCRPGVLAGPWPRPSCRILDRELIEESVRSHTSESFDDMHILGGSPEPGFVREIGGIDDESVAFPVADRIAHPLANRLWQ